MTKNNGQDLLQNSPSSNAYLLDEQNKLDEPYDLAGLIVARNAEGIGAELHGDHMDPEPGDEPLAVTTCLSEI